MTLIQLHWQSRSDPSSTEFVAQGEFSSVLEIHDWAKELIRRRQSEIPEGWAPMLCNDDDPSFVMAASASAE